MLNVQTAFLQKEEKSIGYGVGSFCLGFFFLASLECIISGSMELPLAIVTRVDFNENWCWSA